jgi:hypothetical protein
MFQPAALCSSPIEPASDNWKDIMPPGGIAKYHVLDFGTVKGASEGASAIIAHVNSPKGMRHNTGPKRAVVFGERADGSAAIQARLYLSPGALEAAREVNLTFAIIEELSAENLPGSAILLQGQP